MANSIYRPGDIFQLAQGHGIVLPDGRELVVTYDNRDAIVITKEDAPPSSAIPNGHISRPYRGLPYVMWIALQASYTTTS